MSDSEEDDFEIQLDDCEKEITNETSENHEVVQRDRWIQFLNLDVESKVHSKIESFRASIVSGDVKEFLRLIDEDGQAGPLIPWPTIVMHK